MEIRNRWSAAHAVIASCKARNPWPNMTLPLAAAEHPAYKRDAAAYDSTL